MISNLYYKGMREHWRLWPVCSARMLFKILCIMKLIAMYILVLCTCTIANVNAQKVSLAVKNASFKDVAMRIQKQTEIGRASCRERV